MKMLYSLVGISKQSHFQRVSREQDLVSRQPCYMGLIETVRQMHPSMGLRAIYDQFEPEGIGRDAFIKLGLEAGYRIKTAENPIKTTQSVKTSRYKNLLADYRLTDVNQLWVSDIFYFPLEGRHFYVVLIMDVYSRLILGYSIADNMRAENNVSALNMALAKRRTANYDHKLIHHSDRGGQYISDKYTETLDKYKIRISMCTDVLENAHCERVNGTIKNGYMKAWHPETQKQLFASLPKAVNNYNNRQHASLNRMTPIHYETYIKELELNQRTVMKIFTMKQKVGQDPNQLSLFADCHFII